MGLKYQYGGEGFADFLKQVLDYGDLSDTSAGITKQVIDKGIGSLSDKQRQVFEEHVVRVYAVEKCARCKDDIPWSEMFAAHDNGGYCGPCEQRRHKDE